VTRRHLIALAALALARASGSASAIAAEPDDAEILVRLIAREEEAVAAHAGAAAADERDHARALRSLLDALGRQAPPGPESAPGRDPVAVESALIEDYRTALLELRDPGILRTAGTILASHSQHRVRARLDAGLDPFTSDP
jgi:hypothetical protein